MENAHEIFNVEMKSITKKLKPHGMIKFHSSHLFLAENKLMFGNWLEYRDIEAFTICDEIWQKSGEEFAAKYGDMFADVKFSSYRGQVFQHWT